MFACAGQVGPQSSAKTPTPRIPLKVEGPVSGLGHDEGTAPKVESITWIGTRTRGSFASPTSAVATGPQSAVPSPNWTHSASEPPPGADACGSETVSTCLNT